MSVLESLDTPGDWHRPAFWTVAPRVKESGQPNAQPLSVFLDAGVVPRDSRVDNHNQLGEDLSRYLVVHPGDIVFNKLRTWQGGLGASRYSGIVSPAYYVCRPNSTHDSRFIHYLLRSAPYLAELTRISKMMPPSQFDTPWEDLRQLRILSPPLIEQRRISDFLDGETHRMDQISMARDQQLLTLKERELAVIADMLSGSDVSARRKQTGWPWLPTIPETWETGPVYAYFETNLGKMLNPERATGGEKKPYLRNANVHWYEISTTDIATMSFEPWEHRRYAVRDGDLLICEGGAGVAEAAIWRGDMSECYYQKSLHRARPIRSIPVEWLMYWLRLAKSSGVFESDGNIATIPHLTGEQLRRYRIPIPSDHDRALKSAMSGIETLSYVGQRLREAQETLNERRQALITAVVTGQIDVSTASGRGIED